MCLTVIIKQLIIIVEADVPNKVELHLPLLETYNESKLKKNLLDRFARGYFDKLVGIMWTEPRKEESEPCGGVERT